MTDTAPRWERLAWRALQHADLMLRQWRQSLRLDLNPKKHVTMTAEQARCPHPRRQHRRGGNRHGSYTHCSLCKLRLNFVSAAEREKQKTSSTSTSTPPTSTRANPKAAPTPSAPKPSPSPPSATPANEELLAAVLMNQQKQTEIISNSLQQVVRQQQELTGALMQSMGQLQAQLTQATGGSSASHAAPTPPAVQPDHAAAWPATGPETVDLTMDDSDSDPDLEYVP